MREYGDAHHPKLLRKANKYVYGDDDEFKKTISDIMSDSFVPIVVKITRTGAMSIYEDTQLDTSADDNAPADEDDGV